MGRIASEWSDMPIVTSDNPRTENPDAILDDVERGMVSDHLRITDRREAIAAALNMARSEDTVLLAGKGHETYQIIGDERIAFDEVAIVRELVGP
jgi:UDP-N-acetylmuramoyl-L-alanyl-D-glutamate--2,6-diaminopimelate ligase